MTELVPMEVFPITGGALIGLLSGWLVPRRLRVAVAASLSAVVGFLAAYLSGELKDSWAFLVFDVGQALAASMVTLWLVQARARGRAARRISIR
jgi:small basic protein